MVLETFFAIYCELRAGIMLSRARVPTSKPRRSGRRRRNTASATPAILFLLSLLAAGGWWFHRSYVVSLQPPFELLWRPALLIFPRSLSGGAEEAMADQSGKALSRWQQYACQKFGPACRVALAIQRAENPEEKCEVYHYNRNGTLDWGYFQINTVHLERPGLNLRDLLDCQANIDFAYLLFREKGGFSDWSTFNNGVYRRYLIARSEKGLGEAKE